MKPSELVREALLPLIAPPVLMTMLLFFGLFQIVMIARVFGIVIMLVLAAQLIVFVLPAMLRYLVVVLEARAFDREPEAVDIDLFPWVGNMWTLFPVVHAAFFAYLTYVVQARFGNDGALVVAALYAFVLPASLITLALTRSSVASLNPVTLYEVVKRLGMFYLAGPAFIAVSGWLVWYVDAELGTDFLTQFVCFYVIFAAFSVFGGMARRMQPEREVDIPAPVGMDEERERELQLINRTAVLNHAYGIISRGNRAKGLQHVFDTLAEDPDAEAAWAWFFDNMLRWENPEAGLVFAQHYVHELLRYGDNVRAVKVMLRCRLINPAFKPLAEDIDLAIHAAEHCRNDELASFLR